MLRPSNPQIGVCVARNASQVKTRFLCRHLPTCSPSLALPGVSSRKSQTTECWCPCPTRSAAWSHWQISVLTPQSPLRTSASYLREEWDSGFVFGRWMRDDVVSSSLCSVSRTLHHVCVRACVLCPGSGCELVLSYPCCLGSTVCSAAHGGTELLRVL